MKKMQKPPTNAYNQTVIKQKIKCDYFRGYKTPLEHF